MLNKYTIVGLIAGGIISGLGAISFVDFLVNPIDVMNFDDGFGVGESTTFVFQAPENSLQKIMITGSSFDVKVSIPDNAAKFADSYKNKVDLSWTNTISGENLIKIQKFPKASNYVPCLSILKPIITYTENIRSLRFNWMPGVSIDILTFI